VKDVISSSDGVTYRATDAQARPRARLRPGGLDQGMRANVSGAS
jgi:hypothetical protein